MNKKEQNTSQLQIRIRPSLLEKFKKVCEKKYKSVAGAIKEMIVKFVEENEGK
jgi:predicted DNA-binding protein